MRVRSAGVGTPDFLTPFVRDPRTAGILDEARAEQFLVSSIEPLECIISKRVLRAEDAEGIPFAVAPSAHGMKEAFRKGGQHMMLGRIPR
jgi:hypothetical protein